MLTPQTGLLNEVSQELLKMQKQIEVYDEALIPAIRKLQNEEVRTRTIVIRNNALILQSELGQFVKPGFATTKDFLPVIIDCRLQGKNYAVANLEFHVSTPISKIKEVLSVLPLFVRDEFIQADTFEFISYSLQCSEDDRDGPQDELSEDLPELEEGTLKELPISEGIIGDYKALAWSTKLVLVMKIS